MQRVINRNKYIERNLCITLVIYQESLHDARSTKCKITSRVSVVPLLFRQAARQTSRPTVYVESDELFPGWCVVDPSSVWGSFVGDCQQLTKLRTSDSLSLFGSSSGHLHFSLNLLNHSRTVFLWTVSSILWFSVVPTPPPRLWNKTLYSLAAAWQQKRTLRPGAAAAAADEVIEPEFFRLSLTVLTGGDRNRSQLVYAPKPHLRDSISAVTLYCFISQDVKLSLRAGKRLEVYCSPVGNDTRLWRVGQAMQPYWIASLFGLHVVVVLLKHNAHLLQRIRKATLRWLPLRHSKSMFRIFHCFTVHFDSLSSIHTNSCTFSYNYVSVF